MTAEVRSVAPSPRRGIAKLQRRRVMEPGDRRDDRADPRGPLMTAERRPHRRAARPAYGFPTAPERRQNRVVSATAAALSPVTSPIHIPTAPNPSPMPSPQAAGAPISQ